MCTTIQSISLVTGMSGSVYVNSVICKAKQDADRNLDPGSIRDEAFTGAFTSLTPLIPSLLKRKEVTGFTYVGSLAKFKKRQTLSIEPFSSKSDLKNRAVSMFT